MVIMVCKEEVFNWFKELSGAKRIELMCGLMSMCIPLEIRFFEAIVRDLAKKDLNALREAEIKANSYQELDTICKCNLLADKAINESNELKPNTNCEITATVVNSNCSTVQQSLQQSLQQSSQQTPQVLPQVIPMQDLNGTTLSLATNEMIGPTAVSSPANASNNLSLLPSRSKLIVSLCLLSPTNRTCSTLAYKALRTQLTAKSIANAVYHCLYLKGCFSFDDFFSEILLLLTMAVHHPAFSYEQRDILAKQKEEVELTIDGINSSLRQTNFQTPNAHHFQPFQQQSIHHQQQQQQQQQGMATHTGHAVHTHHQMPAQPAFETSQQYSAHTHPYMPGMAVTNLSYSSAQTSAVLPNMSNLRISSMTSPVSTPSPTNSPSASSKPTGTPVSAISPIPIPTEFAPHVISLNESTNTAPYVLTTLPQLQTNAMETPVSVKQIISCYNCGNIGHRGDECTVQTQDEANR